MLGMRGHAKDVFVGTNEKAIVGFALLFGPGIRISCTGRHKQPRVRLSLRKAA
jgi:hypothetical protein